MQGNNIPSIYFESMIGLHSSDVRLCSKMYVELLKFQMIGFKNFLERIVKSSNFKFPKTDDF